jgi:hypothetical protein
MTWKLVHDGETVGEWSDDLINKVVKELMNTNKSSSSKLEGPKQKGSTNIISEFLPDPIRDALLSSPQT